MVGWLVGWLVVWLVGVDSQSANNINLGGMPGVPAMHVSTSCLENEAGMTATTLLGEASQRAIEHKCSWLGMARFEMMLPSGKQT